MSAVVEKCIRSTALLISVFDAMNSLWQNLSADLLRGLIMPLTVVLFILIGTWRFIHASVRGRGEGKLRKWRKQQEQSFRGSLVQEC
jgi:hypothetical protein